MRQSLVEELWWFCGVEWWMEEKEGWGRGDVVKREMVLGWEAEDGRRDGVWFCGFFF